jgi:hypothetical protein
VPLRIQAMFLAAFVIAYAMFVASLASAEAKTAGAEATALLTPENERVTNLERGAGKNLAQDRVPVEP